MSPGRLRATAGIVATLLLCVAADAVAANPDADLLGTVRKANAEWAEAMKTGDAAVIVAPYAEGAVFVLPDGTTLHGRTEIEKLYRDGFAKAGPVATTDIESRSVVRDGDLAYESGFAEVGAAKDGRTVSRGSRYVTVWQKQADGAWKILRNVVLP